MARFFNLSAWKKIKWVHPRKIAFFVWGFQSKDVANQNQFPLLEIQRNDSEKEAEKIHGNNGKIQQVTQKLKKNHTRSLWAPACNHHASAGMKTRKCDHWPHMFCSKIKQREQTCWSIARRPTGGFISLQQRPVAKCAFIPVTSRKVDIHTWHI